MSSCLGSVGVLPYADDEPAYTRRFTPASRAGDVHDSQADISKAKKLLDYVPIVPLDDGLKHTLDWCRAESGLTAR